MNNFTHGGNLREAINKYNYNISGSRIIDFSSNINPLGVPESIIFQSKLHIIANTIIAVS